MKKTFSALVLIKLLTIYSCASIKTPSGGLKDTKPPVVLKMIPENYTVNFTGKKIVFHFNEYFNLQNELKEISISPILKKNLEFKIQGKNLTVLLKDSAPLKNTTYIISFGKAIADVTERNILKNFKYIFSTGNTIDSLNIVGKVINEISQKPEKDILVIIHPNKQDSLFSKKAANLFTLTDSAGRFLLSNLKRDSVNIFALKDKNGNRFFDEGEDIAFIKNAIVPKNSVTDTIQLFTFKQELKKLKITKKSILKNGTMKVGFNKALKEYSLHFIYPIDSIKHKHFTTLNTERDSLEIFVKNIKDLDSIKFYIQTEKHQKDTLLFNRNKKEKITGDIKIQANIKKGLLKPKEKLLLTLSVPIEEVIDKKVSLYQDSIKIKDFSLLKNTQEEYEIKHSFLIDKKYTIKFLDSAFVGINQLYNKFKEITFKYDNPENYGNIVLKTTKKNPIKNYLLEFLDPNEKVVLSMYVAKPEEVFSLFLVEIGKYRIRIIEDENKNGKWDTGNLNNKIQPEKVTYYEKSILIKQNWDIEEKINL